MKTYLIRHNRYAIRNQHKLIRDFALPPYGPVDGYNGYALSDFSSGDLYEHGYLPLFARDGNTDYTENGGYVSLKRAILTTRMIGNDAGNTIHTGKLHYIAHISQTSGDYQYERAIYTDYYNEEYLPHNHTPYYRRQLQKDSCLGIA